MKDDKNNLKDEYSLEAILEEARRKKQEREKKLTNEPLVRNTSEKPVYIGKKATENKTTAPVAAENKEKKFKFSDKVLEDIDVAPKSQIKPINEHISKPIEKPINRHTNAAKHEDYTEKLEIPDEYLEDAAFDRKKDDDQVGFTITGTGRRNPHALTPEELLGRKVKPKKQSENTLASTLRVAALKAEKIVKRDLNNEVDSHKHFHLDDDLEPKSLKKQSKVIKMTPNEAHSNNNPPEPLVDSNISSNYNDLKNSVSSQIDKALLDAELLKTQEQNVKPKRFAFIEPITDQNLDIPAKDTEKPKANKLIDDFIAKPISRQSQQRKDPDTKLKSVEQNGLSDINSNNLLAKEDTSDEIKDTSHVDYEPLNLTKKAPENLDTDHDTKSFSSLRNQVQTHIDETKPIKDDTDLYLNNIDSVGNIIAPIAGPEDRFEIEMKTPIESANKARFMFNNSLLDNDKEQTDSTEDENDPYVSAYPQRPVSPVKEALTMSEALDYISESGYSDQAKQNEPETDTYDDMTEDEIDNYDSYISPREKKAIKKVTRLNDYEKLSDATTIRYGLEKRKKSAFYTVIVSVMITGILMLLRFLYAVNIHLMFFEQNTLSNAQYNITVMLIFLLIVCLINIKIFTSIGKVFIMQANHNSAAALTVFVILIHEIMLIRNPAVYLDEKAISYALIGCLVLTINAVGNFVYASNARENFEIIANESLKRSSFLVESKQAAISIATGTIIGQPQIIATGKTVNHRRFLRDTFSSDPSDTLCSKLSLLSLIFATGFSMVIYMLTSDIIKTSSFFTVSIILINPFFASLIVSMPMGFVNNHLRQKGTIITGYRSVDKMNKSNAIALDAQDLFPIGTVKIYSIQTFGNHKIDEVLLEAAGVAIKGGGSLADVFDQVIQGHIQMLPNVDKLRYEDNKGAVGYVSDKEILVGNRDLLDMNSITLPDFAVEAEIRQEGKYPIYLASGGELCAMFVVGYEVSDRVYDCVGRIARDGNMLLVRTVDPNIDAEMICRKFEISPDCVHIMGNDGAETFNDLTRLTDRAGSIVTKGHVTQAVNAISTCITLFSNIKISIIIQMMFCLLGFGAFLAFNFTDKFTTFAYGLIPLIVFQLIVGIVSLSISIFRKNNL